MPGTAATRRRVVPDGEYDIRLSLADAAGNTGAAGRRGPSASARPLGFVTTSKAVFYPQDGDTYAAHDGARLSPRSGRRPSPGRSATRAGAIVETLADAQPPSAGTYALTFDGMKLDGSARLPVGKYTSYVERDR